MKIGLDLDGTITQHPMFFSKLSIKLDNEEQQELENTIVRGVVEADMILHLLRCHDSSNVDVVKECIATLCQKGFSQDRAEWIASFYRKLSRSKQADPNDADCEQCKHYSQEECEVDNLERETVLDNNLQGYCTCFERK